MDTPCPKYKVDLQNTGQSNEIGPVNNITKFSVWVSYQIYTGLTIYNNKLWIPKANKFIDLNNGEYSGQCYFEESGLDIGFTIFADNKMFHSAKTGIICSNLNGSTIWYTKISNPYRCDMSVDKNGNVYFSSGKVVYVLNGSNGEQIWNFTTIADIITMPATDNNGIMYFCCNNGDVYALNQSGKLKWNISLPGVVYYSSNQVYPVRYAPSIGFDGTIYIGCKNGHIYALNPNGTLKWNFSEDSKTVYCPSIGKDCTIYFGSNNKNFYALNPNGTLKWKFTARGAVAGSPVISSNNIVYVGEYYYGNIYALNCTDGTLVWKYFVRIAASLDIGTLCIYNNTLYFIEDKRVHAISNSAPKMEYNISFYKNNYDIGENVYLDISAHNEGAEDAKNLTFNFKLPNKLEYIISENVTYDNTTGIFTYNFGNIEVNSTVNHRIA